MVAGIIGFASLNQIKKIKFRLARPASSLESLLGLFPPGSISEFFENPTEQSFSGFFRIEVLHYGGHGISKILFQLFGAKTRIFFPWFGNVR